MEMQTGPQQITLTKEIEIDGTKVKALVMREPTVGDQLAAQRSAPDGDEVMAEINLIANLCMLSAADVQKLAVRDFKKVQKVLVGFTV